MIPKSIGRTFLLSFLAFWLALFAPHELVAQCPGLNLSITPTQLVYCGSPANIVINNTSTGINASTATYNWFRGAFNFANTTGLASVNDTRTVGTYTYTCIATDTAGCSATTSVSVQVLRQPVAAFTFSPNNQCSTSPITFINNSTGVGGGTTYLWNFGDGFTSTNTNPTHSYPATGGTFNVTLTVTNGPGCTSTITIPVTVSAGPNAAIAGDDGDGNTVYCLVPGDPATTDPVTFSNTTTGAVSYAWDFGDGTPIFTTGSLANFVHAYTAYGTYTVTMTATAGNGCTAVQTLTVIFERRPTASISITPAENGGCTPHIVCPLNNSQNATNFLWNFGDGFTTTAVSPCHTYTAGGNYTITLTATNSCPPPSVATVGPIIVTGQPTIGFNMNPNPGCAPQVVTFGNTSTGAVPVNSYTWHFGRFPGDSLVNVFNPPAQTYQYGVWTVMLVGRNACGTDTLIRQLVIDSLPRPLIVVNPTIGCTPLTVNVTNNTLNPGLTPRIFQWFIDGSGAPTYTTYNIPPQIFTAPPGNTPVVHTIRLRVTNACGFRDTTVSITVHPAVVAQFTASPTALCVGGNITFNQTSLGSNLTYAWNFGNGNTSTLPGPHTQTYNTVGTFNVTLTVTGFCGTSTQTIPVTIRPYPVINFTTTPDSGCVPLAVTIVNSSTAGGTNTWNFGAGAAPATSTAYNPPVVTYNTAGTKVITYTINLNGCVTTRTDTVIARPKPTVAFTALPASGCAPLTVTLNNTTATIGGETWAWDFGDGNTSTVQNPGTHVFTNPGPGTIIRNIKLVVTNGFGCKDSLIRPITIFPIPIANFTVNPDSGCLPLTVTFVNSSTVGATYAWNFGAGAAPATSAVFAPPAVTYSTAGIKTITLTVTRNGCSATHTDTVIVTPRPVVAFTALPASGCAPLTVAINNTTATVGGETWSWTFGDGNTSNVQNPGSHVYPNPGPGTLVFNIKLVVDNGFGCKDSLTRPITVFPLPVATFTHTPDSGCQPLTVTFVNGSTAGATYAWNFGAGAAPATSTAFTPPAVVYSTPGIKTITLVVTRNGCSTTFTDTVTVRPRPVVAFTALPATGCSQHTVAFTNTTTTVGGETWAWTFGDGATSNVQNPGAHVYTNPGPGTLIRTVKLVVTNGYGCSDSTTRTVTIYPQPIASFTNPANACVTFGVPFTNTTTGASTYAWTFGDGSTSTQTNPVHAYAATGNYAVTLIATTTFGCRDTAVGTVQLDTIPDAQWVADTVCIGNPTQFTDLSAGSPANWAWTFGDGNTSTLQNPTHTYATFGTFTVKLVVTNAFGCPDSLIRQVLVNPVPVANFTAPPACNGAPNIFTSTSTGSPTQWFWDFGDGNTATIANPTHVYALPNTYNVTLIVVSGVGCSDTITRPVIVNPVPVTDFAADTVCYLLTTTFTDLSTGAPNTWAWTFGDGGTSTAQNPTHYYNAAGSYTVTLVAGYAATGCRDTMVHTVIVHPRPVVAFTTGPVCLNDTTDFLDQTSNNPNQWLWDFGDGLTSALQNPTHVYASPTTYNVELWAQNVFGCADSLTQAVTVYPRPVAAFVADTVCQHLQTTFTDQSSAAVSWHYDFGDGNADTVSSPIHLYVNAGSYTVTQIVWNVFGCTDTVQHVIIVDSLPVAAFAVDTSCFGFANHFTDFSTVNAASLQWNWDFGDTAGTSVLQNPAYIYGDSGTYTVTLIVQNNLGCGDTISHPVIIYPIPIAGWVNPTACARNLLQFTDTTTSDPNQWLWDFGDGSPTTTLQNPTHTYAVGGSYNVTLIAGNNVGCFDTAVVAVPVYTVPVPAFGADTVCAGTATQFTNGSTDPNPMTYLWLFGDGNSSPALDPQYVYADSGLYTVELTAFNNYGCRDSVFHDVYVAPIPAVDFSGDTVCLGQSTTFAGLTSSYATAWAWDFGDGGTDTLQSPQHTFNLSGNQTVSLWAGTAYGCADSITRNIFVEIAPVANFSFSQLHCEGTAIDFTNLTFGAVSSMQWSFSDGGTSTLINPSHTYQAPGSYLISLVASSSNGCADTASLGLYVNDLPQAAFVADTVCIGGFTQFMDSSSGDSLDTWFWDFGNNSNTAYGQTPGHVYYPSADTFSVSLVVTNVWGCSDTTVGSALVTPTAVAAFSSNPTLPASLELYEATVNFTNQSQFADFWSWDFGDGDTSGIYSPSHTYATFGEYCVTLAVQSIGGCTDTARICNLVILAGVPDIPNTFSPNGDGTNDVFEIRNIDAFPDNTLEVFNRWGNKIYEKDKYHNEWDGRNWKNDQLLPDGAYFYVFKPSPDAKAIVGDVVIFR